MVKDCVLGGGDGPIPTPILALPTERPDFQRFGENIAWFSWMIRLQIIFSLATDEVFAAKTAKAYSATARLKAVATTCNATELVVE